MTGCKGKKVSSYIAHYPILRTTQKALYFNSLVDVFNQTTSQLLWEEHSHAAVNAQNLFVEIFTTVGSQVLIPTAQCTEAM